MEAYVPTTFEELVVVCGGFLLCGDCKDCKRRHLKFVSNARGKFTVTGYEKYGYEKGQTVRVQSWNSTRVWLLNRYGGVAKEFPRSVCTFN
jgi:hypothetical protein